MISCITDAVSGSATDISNSSCTCINGVIPSLCKATIAAFVWSAALPCINRFRALYVKARLIAGPCSAYASSYVCGLYNP